MHKKLFILVELVKEVKQKLFITLNLIYNVKNMLKSICIASS